MPSIAVRERRGRFSEYGLLVGLALLVFAATGVDYFWIGFFPAWLWISLLLVITGPFFGLDMLRLSMLVKPLWRRLILPFCCYCLWAIVRNMGGREAVDLIMLNLSSLFALVMAYAVTAFSQPKRVVMIIGLCAGIQGAVSLGQYLNIDAFWTIPDRVMNYSSRNSVSYEESGIRSFSDTGRVRGTNYYIHKFSAMIGMLTAFLILATMAAFANRKRGSSELVMLSGLTAASFLGLLLTFSRSTLMGTLVAVPLFAPLILRKRSWLPLIFLIVLSGGLVLAFMYLGLGEAAQFSRLFRIVNLDSANDQIRLESIQMALDAFISSPLIGVGMDVTPLSIGVHSLPIRILGSFGLIGFSLYALTWFGIIRSLVQTVRTGSYERAGLAAAGLASLLVALFDAMAHTSGFLQRDIAQATLIGVFLGLGGTFSRNVFLRPANNIRKEALTRNQVSGGR